MPTSVKKTVFISLIGLFFVGAAHFALSATTPEKTTSKEINELDASIKQKKAELEAIKKQQADYKAKLSAKQNERASLQNQIESIDEHAAQTQLNLDQTRIDIETTNLEIQKVTLEMAEQDKKISDNKGHLGSALKLLSQEDDKSQLEILLMNSYLTDYVNQIKYLENINDKISDNLTNLRATKEQLEGNRQQLDQNRERLKTLKSELEEKQVALADEKDAKGFLIDQAKESEAGYQALLSQAKKEQDAASSSILNLEKTLRDRINSQGPNSIKLEASPFIWPTPSHYITAYFHDPSYPFNYLFSHPAIDIRNPQGTPIKAVADGYVGIAKDAGMGYSYITLYHAQGLSTVYGHVSKIYVRPDEYVMKGQIIGLSGATPGTPGAGPFTTGPHLHFEVRKDGIPVDPLDYLP